MLHVTHQSGVSVLQAHVRRTLAMLTSASHIQQIAWCLNGFIYSGHLIFGTKITFVLMKYIKLNNMNLLFVDGCYTLFRVSS